MSRHFLNAREWSLLGLLFGLVLFVFVDKAFCQGIVINPPYVNYGGAEASQEYWTGDMTVPSYKQLDLHRWDGHVTLNASSIGSGYSNITQVNGSGYWYENISYTIVNDNALGVGDYRRVECTGNGFCIAHKTAVRGDASSPAWGMWLYQDNVGPHVAAVRMILADNPEVYGDTSYAIPNIDVIGGNVDVQNAVIQWNVSPKSTGDLIRVFDPNGALKFQITKDGSLIVDGISLETYIAQVVAKAVAKAMPGSCTRLYPC